MDYSTTKILAILFDLDGTLRHNDPVAHDFFFDHAAALGVPDALESRRAAMHWAHRYWNGTGIVVRDAEIHGYDTPAFWLNYARGYLISFGCSAPQADELAPLVNTHMETQYRPENRVDPAVPGVLAQLREMGFTLGIVSNRDANFDGLLAELGLAELCDFSLSAGEAASWKPDPGIFRHALQRAGAAAHETIYVGDNYFADALGARNAGLHPILLDPDRIFPDADCTVIASLADLPGLLGG